MYTPQSNDCQEMQPSVKDYHYRRLLLLAVSDMFLIRDASYSQPSKDYLHHSRLPGTGSNGTTH